MAYYLVQGDTSPQIKITVSRDVTNEIVDMTGATVYLKIRPKSSTTLTMTLTSISSTVELSQGIAIFVFDDGDLDIPAGSYDGEVEINFSNGSIETVYELVKFFLREDF